MSRAGIIALTSRQGPMTAKQIAFELGVGAGAVNTSLRRARAHGTQYIRIAAWAMDVPKYGPGPGEDAEGGSTGTLIRAHLVESGPATVSQLAEALGASAEAIQSAIVRLRAKPRRGGLVITGWKLTRGTGGREAPIHGVGVGPDAPRLDFSNAQRDAERRYNQKRRVRSAMAGVATRPQRITAGHAGFFDGLMR